ncbi:MAG: 16S rRNA (cytosine(967)-C(5))-methyltransferase RsmB [Tatlockia sp.]|jgi:16S rRNA (cytosine967-C5)-methyltransferase
MKKNERFQALQILVKLVSDKVPLSHAMQGDVTPLTKALCFGVCRHYFRLEVLADTLMDKRPKALDVWIIILMGLYQLNYLQKPDYAVVKETVALLDAVKKSWAKGLANAVLRTFCREKDTLLPPLQKNAAFQYGHPNWFIQRIKNDWPNAWQAILQANDCHPPMSLRVNQQKIARRDYVARLEQATLKARIHPFTEAGLTLEVPCDVHELPGFAEGEVAVQDESAQLAASLLALQPGLRLLDACCAPGGKTCHILESEPHLADCIALDVDAGRLKRVAENLARLGLHATLLKGDAQKPETWWDGKLFDRILLDAPCSATGVIRRHPDIKLLRTEEEITQAATLQKALLQQLWPLLNANGLLLYATCSVLCQENEQQIAQFVAEHADCQALVEEVPWGVNTGHGWQILPGDGQGDGFFYSVLQKIEK